MKGSELIIPRRMKNKCLFILLVALVPFFANAQKKKKRIENDYIQTDSSASYGVKLVPSLNRQYSKFIKLDKGDDRIVTYYPDQLSSFGYDGRSFVSKAINVKGESKLVFLEKHSFSNSTLYTYWDGGGSRFFLEKSDSSWVELKKSDYQKTLIELTSDQPKIQKVAKYVRLNESSLNRFLKMQDEFTTAYFPHVSFGLGIGLSRNNLSPSFDLPFSTFSELPFKDNQSILLNAHLQIPLKSSDFYIVPTVAFQKTGTSSSLKVGLVESYVIQNISTIMVQVPFQYIYPGSSFRPYANIGFGALFNYKKSSEIYRLDVEEGYLTVERYSVPEVIPSVMYGFDFGGGIQVPFFRGHSFSFGLCGGFYQNLELSSFRQIYSAILSLDY